MVFNSVLLSSANTIFPILFCFLIIALTWEIRAEAEGIPEIADLIASVIFPDPEILPIAFLIASVIFPEGNTADLIASVIFEGKLFVAVLIASIAVEFAALTASVTVFFTASVIAPPIGEVVVPCNNLLASAFVHTGSELILFKTSVLYLFFL